MRSTVIWHPEAQNDLTSIWLNSADRKAITESVHRIDTALSEDPQFKGEEFYGDRIYVASPLAVTYTVSTEDRIVQILQVWHP